MSPRHGRGGAVPAPGQLSLDDMMEQARLEAPAPCIYRSAARGLAARSAEFAAWEAGHGAFGSYSRSHAWHAMVSSALDGFLDRCETAILMADLRPPRDKPVPACGCDGPLMYRAACRRLGCDWEGPGRAAENPAAEDGCDHAWPGWRDLPVVPAVPQAGSGLSAGDREAIARWAAKVNAVYPAGWLEGGGPVRTLRTGHGTRHLPARTPWGGYDLAVLAGTAPQ